MLSKMLRAAAGNQAPAPTTDPNFKQVSLLLHGDGTNGTQNNTFLDSSTNNFTITRNGTTTQGTFTPFSQDAGYWSNYFDGSGDYLQTPTSASLVPSGNYTVEGWFYYDGTFTVADYGRAIVTDFLANSNSRWFVWLENSGKLTFSEQNNNGGADVSIIDSTAIQTNTWVHFAAVKNGTTMQLFKNGVSVGTATSAVRTFPGRLNIGQLTVDAGYRGYWLGYISNIRFLVGTALYTSNFTPSTTPLTAITNTRLLTCQSSRFVDNSSNNFTITRTGDVSVQPFSPFAPTSAYSTSVNGGSAYFNGTTDFLSYTEQSFSTNFTAECWFYRTATGTVRHNIYSTNLSASPTNLSRNCQLAVHTDGSIFVALNSTAIFNNVGGNVVPLNTWNHIVYVRSGTNLSVFVNGVRIANATNSDVLYISSVGVLRYSNNVREGYVFGYLSSLRVTNTVVYDPALTTLTVPTAPLTAITNTSLLLSGTNAGIFDNAEKNNLLTVGNAQVSTSVVKYGTGSMSFDGTGDYLSVPDSPSFEFGSGNFTIECWVYPTAVGQSGYSGIYGKPLASNFGGIALIFDPSTYTLRTYASSTGTSWNLVAGAILGTLTPNTWNYVTVTRSGTNIYSFLNGVLANTTGVSTTALVASVGRPVLIGSSVGTANTYITGYIDDLRVTKGVARYTANFTPPTQAFFNQ